MILILCLLISCSKGASKSISKAVSVSEKEVKEISSLKSLSTKIVFGSPEQFEKALYNKGIAILNMFFSHFQNKFKDIDEHIKALSNIQTPYQKRKKAETKLDEFNSDICEQVVFLTKTLKIMNERSTNIKEEEKGKNIQYFIKEIESVRNKIANYKGGLPLKKAITSKNEQAVKILLNEDGIDKTFKDGGKTALHYAASKSTNIIKVLIDAGLDVNAQDNEGKIPLIEAIIWANITIDEEAVKVLIDAGSDVNNKDIEGNTLPIFIAITQGETRIIRWLLEADADTTVKNSDDQTPLEYVKSLNIVGKEEIIKIFEEFKIN